MANYADSPIVAPRVGRAPAAREQTPDSYAELWAAIKPERDALLNHEVYARLDLKPPSKSSWSTIAMR